MTTQDCRNEELVNLIFGDVTNFAQQVETNGDNFQYNGWEILYDATADIHYFHQI